MYIYIYFSESASMSVKEILQSLVDDAMVDTDKIGTSVYFWAYPSKALHMVSQELVGWFWDILLGLEIMRRV